MTPDGQVRRVELLRSTGSTALDQAVQTMLRAASLPPFPPSMTQPEVTLTVAIQYKLTP
jgi:TonB family protein